MAASWGVAYPLTSKVAKSKLGPDHFLALPPPPPDVILMPKRTYSQMSRALDDQLKQNEKLRAENKANGAKVAKLKKMVVTG